MTAYRIIPLLLQFANKDPKNGGMQGKTAFTRVNIPMYEYMSIIQTQDKNVMNNLKK